jgi:hypothetical protein
MATQSALLQKIFREDVLSSEQVKTAILTDRCKWAARRVHHVKVDEGNDGDGTPSLMQNGQSGVVSCKQPFLRIARIPAVALMLALATSGGSVRTSPAVLAGVFP